MDRATSRSSRPWLGDYQVRSDLAIRRHWQMVCCAFSFCWWAYGRLPTEEPDKTETLLPRPNRRKGEAARGFLAGRAEGGEGVVGAVDHAETILESVLRDAPAAGAKSAA